MNNFYIGIFNAAWMARMPVPFMVSRRILEKRKTMPRASVPYALDSGGFTELSKYGAWSISERKYADIVHRIVDHVGMPSFVAPMDRMCEPFICSFAGKTVLDHIRETVANYLALRKRIDDSIYLLPVIQGYSLDEYIHCIQLYADAGVFLREYPVVGLGSICRRQRTKEGISIIQAIAALGIQLHGFGLKTTALQVVAGDILSADSMAWSFAGRRSGIPGNANSFDYMMGWHSSLMQKLSA